MLYEIRGEQISAVIDSLGAQLMSIKKENTEYLWQGDAEYWADRALTLFPYIARLTDGKYQYQGREYKMDIHGFAKDSEFQLIERKENEVILEICDTSETKKCYPFSFRFQVTYKIEGNRLSVSYRVENCQEETIYFAVGGHPGFQVPIEKGLRFDQYRLRFPESEKITRIEFTPDCFLTGKESVWELEQGKIKKLQHSLFNQDAIVIKDSGNIVQLYAPDGKRSVTVEYPDMKYLGIWHTPGKEAPYVCLEPWSALPSRKGIIEDLATQPDLTALEGAGVYNNTWSIILE